MWSIWYHRLKIPCVCICILIYFGFHGYHGNRGYLTRIQLEKRVASLNYEHENLVQTRENWERRNSLMRADQLDLDLLDERARDLSAKIKDDELIVQILD